LFFTVIWLVTDHLRSLRIEEFLLGFEAVAYIDTLLEFVLVNRDVAFPEMTFNHDDAVIDRFLQIRT